VPGKSKANARQEKEPKGCILCERKIIKIQVPVKKEKIIIAKGKGN